MRKAALRHAHGLISQRKKAAIFVSSRALLFFSDEFVKPVVKR
jgi:hypothetical protein